LVDEAVVLQQHFMKLFSKLSYCPRKGWLHNTTFTIEQGKLVAIDSGLKENAKEVDGILVPGFINAHCHLELSYLASQIGKGGGLPNFIKAVISRRNNMSQEARLHAAQFQNKLMEQNGIVAVLDIANTTESILAKENTGINYITALECFDLTPSNTISRWEEILVVKEAFDQALLPNFITAHAPYTVTDQLMKKIAAIPSEFFTIHHMESAQEQSFIDGHQGSLFDMFASMGIPVLERKKYSSSVAFINQYMEHKLNKVWVHNTYATITDLQQLSISDNYFCTCPNANLWIEEKLPPLDLWQQAQLKVVVGTDSMASNSKLCIANELVTIHQHFEDLPFETITQWATINGADAIGLSDRLGSFEIGKTPGFIQLGEVSMERPKYHSGIKITRLA
jgi:aminodeoxyfutalosine deaminase